MFLRQRLLSGAAILRAADDAAATGAPAEAPAGPISMQQAMGIMAQRRQAPTEPAAAAPSEPVAADETESEAAPPADDTSDPDDEPAIEGEETDETEEAPATPALNAPKSWAAHERAEFAKLPRNVQEIILGRETERDEATSRALNDASKAKTAAEAEVETRAQAKVQAEIAKIAELHTTLSQTVTDTREAFAGKWAGWDEAAWAAYARQDPMACVALKADFEADMATINRARQAADVAMTAKQEAERTEFQNYVAAETAKLPTIAPELADPKEGTARIERTAKFLRGLGLPPEALNRISAVELSLAYDAMQFREGKAAVATQAKRTAPPPAPAPAAAAPSAAPARPSRQRTGEAAMGRLKDTGKMDDALAVLRARRKA